MRTPSPPYCGLDLAPPLADRFVLGVASLTTAQYFSAYPSDPASRRAPCPPKHVERRLQVRLCLCPPFAPRAPGDVSVPFLSLRPARHYPRFWVRRSSSERRRDLNPPYLGAAQRTLRTQPPPSRLQPTSRFRRLYGLPCSSDFSPGRGGLLQSLGMSLSPCCHFHPAEVTSRIGQCSASHSAFAPTLKARPSGIHFRGHNAFTFVTAR